MMHSEQPNLREPVSVYFLLSNIFRTIFAITLVDIARASCKHFVLIIYINISTIFEFILKKKFIKFKINGSSLLENAKFTCSNKSKLFIFILLSHRSRKISLFIYLQSFASFVFRTGLIVSGLIVPGLLVSGLIFSGLLVSGLFGLMRAKK